MKFPSLMALAAYGLVAASSPAAPAALTPTPLDAGLAYVRVHSFAADGKAMQAACSAGGALVIDLRYPAFQDGDEAVLQQALATRNGNPPLYVLVSPSTPGPFGLALTRIAAPLTTLGIADSIPPPKVVVFQSAEMDRRAYDAADAGKELSGLISGKIPKERYDEASLVNDFNNGNPNPEPPAAPDPREPRAGAKTAPLVDRVLQRAVQLNRALVAIKPRS
jgi:hypothetical protein